MKHRAFVFGLIVIAVVFGFDQWTKQIAIDELSNPHRVIEVTSFMNFLLAWNPGVSFGLFQGQAPWVMIAATSAITLGFLIWMWRTRDGMLGIALALVVGGAVGNLIDRLRHGAVTDFIDLHVAGYHWPVFNIADSAITVGAALLLIDSLFGGKKSSR
ncbi:signal peptidase II [Thalassospira alkalitolerans]|uniref:Lipoprotein signal peptidase n=1 Tax=Thalassospira alkalitolerans TaxID=1293890 RepID=A0A1Y2LAI0_9PROT|nr:signal peptidase II [Thalassospira alkalitolerans]OSQ46705.1 peptidase A8 [Thalassospira alkalitolerans]|tara:strand:- start:22821 stop:23294 length:474 start_codon:yes stop_codon:yes gene_type:complete